MLNAMLRNLLFFAVVCGLLTACSDPQTAPEAQNSSETEVVPAFPHADWSKDATIYEVNIRQHTPEGTFAAFTQDIDRISGLGIEILWLMPIHPIGEVNRKGGLGSYYSIQDYKAVNPEFGSEADFQALVNKAHSLGMKVIIDWVPNHTAWDCVWTPNRDWYSQNEEGEFYPPVADWSDVIDLNYDNQDMRAAMIDALKYWMTEFDIDGYRCDVAGEVPLDFWNDACGQLRAMNPEIFMLAEAEVPEHHAEAFDMSYSWELMHIMNQLAMTEGLTSPELMEEKGWHPEGKTLASIDEYMTKEAGRFADYAYRMSFTTNHDENSWNGTVFERFGPAYELFACMAYTIQGMPLLYSGTEAPNRRRLAFFEKDSIDWNGYEMSAFYGKLLKANREHPALWNGSYGGDFKRIATSNDAEIYAYSRTKGDSQVITVLNFSADPQQIKFQEAISGEYPSIFNNQTLSVFTDGDMTLGPWGYQVFVKQ